MVGPAVGGWLHQLGGYILPFIVEGSVALLQTFLVVCGIRGAFHKETDYAHIVVEAKATWKKVFETPPIMLRNGSGYSLNIFQQGENLLNLHRCQLKFIPSLLI